MLPLTYQREPEGQLVLAPRSPDETFSSPDKRLLDDLARQAGVVAHAVRLTADLQRSRERLVTTREEERRGLRRDLHDGVGPQLAALTLRLETARNRLAHDPETRDLLADLSQRARNAVADIRRSVYALRPPALDELGLVSALRETAAQYGHSGLSISVDAPESLPLLPAAVEVAAYRIAQEAATNVARHAGARNCAVRVSLDGEAEVMRLEVVDDGRGIRQGTARWRHAGSRVPALPYHREHTLPRGVNMAPIRILIADDHPIFRDGMRGLLDSVEDTEAVGEASSREEAVELAEKLQLDVILMDVNIEATRETLHASPHIGVLVVTMFQDDDSVFAAMRAGARGYLLKDASGEEVLGAIRAVTGGGAIFSPGVAQRLIEFFSAPKPAAPPRAFPELTGREEEILNYVSRGKSNQEIAESLYLSLKTVQNHVSNIFTKLQVADRAQAVIRAREAGLGSPEK